MSRFSGKCDLYDHIMMYKHRTAEGSDKKEDLEKARVLYSDEMECFKIFMERTGGILYQHKRLKVDEFNQSFIEKKCPNFKVISNTEQVLDKRSKTGYKWKTTQTYEYYGREYTLKEINKRGVFITTEIHIKTLLDLIPYYPYIVSMCASNKDKETIYISNQSYAESEYEEHLQHGWESNMIYYYREELQDHYREVVLRYYNPGNREQIELLHFDENRRAHTRFKIDPNFKVNWYWYSTEERLPHWTSPKVIDDNTIEISENDYNGSLGHSGKISYVKYEDYPLYLD